jgi:hypothetical protein
MTTRPIHRCAALVSAAMLLMATPLFWSPPACSQETLPQETPSAPQVEPVRVAITNGPQEMFSAIEKGRAPFIPSEPSEADVVWDVEHSTAVSRGDLLMSRVDATVLGALIDRTFAVREVRQLPNPRVIDVKLGEGGKAYTLGDMPELVVDGVRGRYLTAVNVAADGTLQLLFPVYASDDPHMAVDQWTALPKVDLPLGTDCTVVIATSKPAGDLVRWLHAHNGKHDAFLLPAVLAATIEADGDTRLGTADMFTH